jgi:hypothetical protein
VTDAREQALARRVLIVAALCAVATWTMMGRSSGGDPSAPVGTPMYSPSIEMSSGGFSVDRLVVDKPGTVRLQAVNRDGTRRAVTLTGPGVDIRTAALRPGASTSLEATLKPGRYRLSSGGGAAVEVAVGGERRPR